MIASFDSAMLLVSQKLSVSPNNSKVQVGSSQMLCCRNVLTSFDPHLSSWPPPSLFASFRFFWPAWHLLVSLAPFVILGGFFLCTLQCKLCPQRLGVVQIGVGMYRLDTRSTQYIANTVPYDIRIFKFWQYNVKFSHLLNTMPLIPWPGLLSLSPVDSYNNWEGYTKSCRKSRLYHPFVC